MVFRLVEGKELTSGLQWAEGIEAYRSAAEIPPNNAEHLLRESIGTVRIQILLLFNKE